MKKALTALFLFSLLGVGIVVADWMYLRSAAPSVVAVPVDAPLAHADPLRSPSPTTNHYSAPSPSQEHAVTVAREPLPPLGDSDPIILNALRELLGHDGVASVYPEKIIRHLVATIDSLPRAQIPHQILAVKPVGGAFLTEVQKSNLRIAPENSTRYTRYVTIALSIDTKRMVALYVRFYPLFQRAYVDLGYPDREFNDRLIEVLDHLLDAPEDRELERVIQPKVVYRFADSDLESESAGHKILIRMGYENAMELKAKLREIRAELMRQNLPM